LEYGVAVVAATVMGGDSKTCSLHSLGRDLDVARRFAGALYKLSFGQDTDPGDDVRPLASIVFVSG
jgi:hypothetical protein